ncbi:GxxExxY protein [Luteolibacter sp. SL250]|uniref:GxxExxY protein n=1 Tax=Luteolibacter sp. SL250 TaxID=2995170 RepID=UPI002271120F|nr:GxxExxY protein [Luteolibacter sp. SL250]WAC21470.1 GxxExxY protein [Luteolibacter sp. SL250]
MKSKEELNELSGIIVDAAMEVHREFGPGLLERVYEAALSAELLMRGISSERQVPLPVVYKGNVLDDEGYRIDLLVEDCIVVELKTVSGLLPIHEAQLSTYLRLARKNLGLLINFHTVLLKDGIKRRVHQFPSI